MAQSQAKKTSSPVSVRFAVRKDYGAVYLPTRRSGRCSRRYDVCWDGKNGNYYLPTDGLTSKRSVS